MKSGKVKLIVIVLVLLTLAVLFSGCTQSKKSYQANLTKILNDTKSQLDKNSTVKAVPSKSSQKTKDKKELEILKKTRDRLESVDPPDDFYTGHADLLQFLNLYIKGKELESNEAAKGNSKKPVFSPNQSKSAQMLMVANRLLSQAAQEFPFMEYNLLEAFGPLTNRAPRTIPPRQLRK